MRVEALEKAYAESAMIKYDGLQWRLDIGTMHFE